jgi:predicted nucleic acid-binding protein
VNLPEKALVDTSAFYALVSSSDSFHAAAAHTFDLLLDREVELWTTSYVLVEAGALIHRRLGFDPLRTLIHSISGLVQTYWIPSSIHTLAWEQLSERDGKGLSFVDWTTVIASRALSAGVFAFDKTSGWRAYG